MVKLGVPWKGPVLLGLLVALTAIRVPDVLDEGTWRSWAVLPVFVGTLWLFARSAWGAVHHRNSTRGKGRGETKS